MNIDIKTLENAGLTTEQIAAILMVNDPKTNIEKTEPTEPKIVDITEVTKAQEAAQDFEIDLGESNVTSFEDLKRYARGTIVRLPDFADGQPFIAKVKRPSLLALAKAHKIPNALLETAENMFNGNTTTKNAKVSKNTLGEMMELCEIIARATLISPTYDEILEAGLELADNQFMALFSYSQVGIKGLNRFR